MNPTHPSPDQESQITAYLLGELSPEERVAVETELANNAELQELAKALEKTIGLIRNAEPLSEDSVDLDSDSLEFSSERRAALLQTLSTPPQRGASEAISHRIPWYLPLGIAALLMLSLSYLSMISRFSSPDSGAFGRTELALMRDYGEPAEEPSPNDGLEIDSYFFSKPAPEVEFSSDEAIPESTIQQRFRTLDSKTTLDQAQTQATSPRWEQQRTPRGSEARTSSRQADQSGQAPSQVALGYGIVPSRDVETDAAQNSSNPRFGLPAITSEPAPMLAFAASPRSESLTELTDLPDSIAPRQRGFEQTLVEKVEEQEELVERGRGRQIAARESQYEPLHVDPLTGLPSTSSRSFFSQAPQDLSRETQIAQFGDIDESILVEDPLSGTGGYGAGGGFGGGAGGGAYGYGGGGLGGGAMVNSAGNSAQFGRRRLSESRREAGLEQNDLLGTTASPSSSDLEKRFLSDDGALVLDAIESSIRLSVAQQPPVNNRSKMAALTPRPSVSFSSGVAVQEDLRSIQLQAQTTESIEDEFAITESESLGRNLAIKAPSPSPSAKPTPSTPRQRGGSAENSDSQTVANFSRFESKLELPKIDELQGIALSADLVDFEDAPAPIEEREIRTVAREQIALASPALSIRKSKKVSDLSSLTKQPEPTLRIAGKAITENLKALGEVTELAQQLASNESKLIASKANETVARFPLEQETREEPISTFSLNVSDVSFRLAASSLNQNILPAPNSIRPEEFFNAISYHDPKANAASPIAVHTERARFQYGHQQEVLRIGVKTMSSGRHSDTPLNLVLLVDNSGSMERPDRQAIVRRSLESLLSTLSDTDRVSMIAFARRARLWADGLNPTSALNALDDLTSITPEGGTNLETALELAYATARKHFQPKGQNRVILFTDGAANLGNTSSLTLSGSVEEQRQQGIALDCFGIGFDGYDDQRLETLTRNGDGRYAFLNDLEQVENDFIRQLTGALNVAAKNVKVQISFNPQRVTNYRQIGYAKHQLKKEQFRDNRVDAAELAAEEAGTALYILTLNPEGSGPVGDLAIRYQSPETGQFHELNWSLPYTGAAKNLEDTSQGTQLATAAALFAERLAEIPYSQEIPYGDLEKIITRASGEPSLDPVISQLKTMIQQTQSLSGF